MGKVIERFSQLPSSLRNNARWMRLGAAGTPAMIVKPPGETAERGESRPPIVLWMHGRTVNKELDPGRYLRWMRAGIAACAIDLPGHGERFDPAWQQPARALDVVRQMIDEIDPVVEALRSLGEFEMTRIGIGGMSAGGMAALARLCRPHAFSCASVEATTGSWTHQVEREMFRERAAAEIASLDPVENLAAWREIPFQALHARHDEWVPIGGQEHFVQTLRSRYRNPALIEWVVYEESTGAPNEHQGFGRMSADAKDRQRDFFVRWLHSDSLGSR